MNLYSYLYQKMDRKLIMFMLNNSNIKVLIRNLNYFFVLQK